MNPLGYRLLDAARSLWRGESRSDRSNRRDLELPLLADGEKPPPGQSDEGDLELSSSVDPLPKGERGSPSGITAICLKLLAGLRKWFIRAQHLIYIKDPKWRRVDKYQTTGREILAEIAADARIRQQFQLQDMVEGRRWVKGDRLNPHGPVKAFKRALEHLARLPKSKDARGDYKAFLRHYRRALNAQEKNPDSALGDAIDQIAHALFTAVGVDGLQREVVRKVAGLEPPVIPKENLDISKDALFDVIENRLRSVRDHRQAIASADRSEKVSYLEELMAKLKGQTLKWFDPMMSGNSPYRKFRIATRDGTIANLRLPTPTMGDQIAPEFRAYLRSLKARGEVHTYINFQRTSPHRLLDVEPKRSDLIHKLAEEGEFCGTFFAISLDKDSDFYYQRGQFSQKEVTFSDFSGEFMRRLFSERLMGYRLPLSLRASPRLRTEVSGMLEGIWTHVFGRCKTLTIAERRDFLEIAYLLLIDSLVRTTRASYYNNSCKDCIDRGGGTNALMFFTLSLLMAHRGEDGSAMGNLRSFESAMFGDALWARKRAIIAVRMHRALSAAERLVASGRAHPQTLDWLQNHLSFQSASA